MTTLVLSTAPRRRDLTRWALAALIMLAVHAGLVAALMARRPNAMPPGATLPPILIDLSPTSAAPEPQKSDLAPGPDVQQADAPAAPRETPPVEQTIAPTPPQPNPVVAVPIEPKPRPVTEPAKPKPVHEAIKKPSERPPAPKTTAAPRADRQAPTQNAAASGAAAAAATASYDALLAAHLQRFKQYPAESRAAHEQGTVVLSFTIGRGGQVLGSRIGRSSGHPALDADTLALLRRAQPLPAFPPEMHQASKSFNVPISYAIH